MAFMQFGAGLAGGILLAIAHLAALRLNVRLYLSPCAAWRPVLLHLLRLASVAGVLTAVAASAGGATLLAVLAGFTLGRFLWLRRVR